MADEALDTRAKSQATIQATAGQPQVNTMPLPPTAPQTQTTDVWNNLTHNVKVFCGNKQ